MESKVALSHVSSITCVDARSWRRYALDPAIRTTVATITSQYLSVFVDNKNGLLPIYAGHFGDRGDFREWRPPGRCNAEAPTWRPA